MKNSTIERHEMKEVVSETQETIFKVGDTVYDSLIFPGLKGEIISKDNIYIRIQFEHESVKRIYGLDGRSLSVGLPTLSFSSYEVNIEGFSQERPLPEITIDTPVFVKHRIDDFWVLRRFSHFENATCYCFINEKSSKETSHIEFWNYWSLENPLLK